VLRQLFELLDRGEWVQVKREAERLMLLPDLDDGQLAWIYRAGGKACIGLSEFHAAAKLYELGMPYAFKAKEWDCLGFTRHEFGTTLLVLGNTNEAREHLEAYLLDLPRYLDSRRAEGRVHFNLGLLYRQRKEYHLAVAAYRQALHCFVERGEVRNAGDCHQNIAWMLLIQRKPEDARTHIDLASSYLEKLPDDFRTEQLILLALFHVIAGEYPLAGEYLLPILGGRLVAREEHLASASWVEANLHMAQRQLELARASLEKALTHALLARAAHLVNLCSDLKEQLMRETGEAAL